MNHAATLCRGIMLKWSSDDTVAEGIVIPTLHQNSSSIYMLLKWSSDDTVAEGNVILTLHQNSSSTLTTGPGFMFMSLDIITYMYIQLLLVAVCPHSDRSKTNAQHQRQQRTWKKCMICNRIFLYLSIRHCYKHNALWVDTVTLLCVRVSVLAYFTLRLL